MTNEQAWPEAGSVMVVVDFSAISFACWYSAERAQEAGKESLQNHISVCGACTPTAVCEHGQRITQYDAHEVLKTNLSLKMATIREHTGEEPGKFVMALDSHATWRYDLFPNYKGDRDPTKYNPRPEAEAFLREAYPGMQWVKSPGQEADDVIATLVQANKAQRAIVVVTGDKDLHQLLEPRVKVFNPITKRFLDLEKVAKDFYGLGPQHIRACKALWGDNSDSLPNCAPRQQRQLVPLIQASGGDLLKIGDLQKSVSSICWGHLQANFKQILINWKLAGLNSDVPLEWC